MGVNIGVFIRVGAKSANDFFIKKCKRKPVRSFLLLNHNIGIYLHTATIRTNDLGWCHEYSIRVTLQVYKVLFTALFGADMGVHTNFDKEYLHW